MVRSSQGSGVSTFSLPAGEGGRIERIRLRLARSGHLLNRSEVVRLALLALEHVGDDVVEVLVSRLERQRPGRPPAKSYLIDRDYGNS